MVALLDTAMDAIITMDGSHRIVLFNRAAEAIFGWPASEMLGKPLDQLLPARFRAAHGGHMQRFADTGVTSRRMGDSTVLYALRATAEEFPIEASISQLNTPQGKLLTVILRDVSERAQAKADMELFASEAHAILEREKSRIARELHDDLAQSLTALKIDIDWMRQQPNKDSHAVTEKLNGMRDLVDTMVAATRRIAADLRPLVLDDLGLVAAIEWLVQNFTQRHGVSCKLVVGENFDLPEPYASAAFRIVQEALANAAKHAQASQVEVHIARTKDALRLTILDNGVGFSTSAARKPNSLGLMGLRERAYLLKGVVNITSEPGSGTKIEVRFPLDA